LDPPADAIWANIEERYDTRRRDAGRPLLPPNLLFLGPHEMQLLWREHGRAQLASTGVAFPFQPMPTLTSKDRQHPLTALIDFKQAHPEAPVLLVAESQGRQQALLALLQKRGIQPTLVPNWHSFAKAPQEIDWGIT